MQHFNFGQARTLRWLEHFRPRCSSRSSLLAALRMLRTSPTSTSTSRRASWRPMGAQLHRQLRPRAECEVVVLHFFELVAHTSGPQHRTSSPFDASTSAFLGGHAELLLLSSLSAVACMLRASTSPGDFSSRGSTHPSRWHRTSVLSDEVQRGSELH